MDEPKNTALPTIIAFHYQVLIALKECFKSDQDQVVWIEKDGDVSVIGNTQANSTQIEVKNYNDKLTDNHVNFWKTLKNWLAPEFDHNIYSKLILCTTQCFGERSNISNWNNEPVEKKLEIIKNIYLGNKEKNKEKEEKDLPEVYKIQNFIFSTYKESTIKCVIDKVVINSETDDFNNLRNSFIKNIEGSIPKNNYNSFIQGLIGFVYDQASGKSWTIEKNIFIEKELELTGKFSKQGIIFPEFSSTEATDEEIFQLQDQLFVQKIKDIDYDEVIPEAVGNWIELTRTLSEEFDENPLYKQTTDKYQKSLVSKFNSHYRRAKLDNDDIITRSKKLYEDTIGEDPFSFENVTPPREYKNGLIHDAMNDSTKNLKWKVEE